MTTEQSCSVVQLNWCQWPISILSLESIFRLNRRPKRVIWCDNNSPDDSALRIMDWAAGNLDSIYKLPKEISRTVFPPVAKPIRSQLISKTNGKFDSKLDQDAELVVLQTNENQGCASGLNSGLRLVSEDPTDYVWLLNTDSVVDSSALDYLVEDAALRPNIGMWGSTILPIDDSQTIEAQGGAKFYFAMAIAEPLGFGRPRENPLPKVQVEKELSYIWGASMFLSYENLQRIGYIPEHFFLNFEEIAWVTDAGAEFELGYSPKSIVYHQGAASTSVPGQIEKYGGLREYELYSNRIAFTREYKPLFLPIVIVALFGVLVEAILTMKWARVTMMMKWSFWTKKSRLRGER